MQRPLLAALVPVYRAGAFLRARLENLAAQSMAPEMEVIVIDTGSPDNEDDIVLEFREGSDLPVKYIRTPERRNVSAALNLGLAATDAQIIIAASVDDLHRPPDGIERLLRALDDPEVSGAYGDFLSTRESGVSMDASARFALPAFDPRLLFRVCYFGAFPLWRRALHTQYGLFDESVDVVTDYEFWLRCVAGGARFQHVEELVGVYFENPNGVERRSGGRCAEESAEVRRRHWPAAWGEMPSPGGGYRRALESRPEQSVRGYFAEAAGGA